MTPPPEYANAALAGAADADSTPKHLQPDYSAARAFLQALDAEADAFTFQTFTDTAKGSPQPRPDPLASVRTGPFDDLAPWLAEQNARGAGVFVTVNETDYRGRRMDNIARVRAVWQEDDGDGKPLPLEPHIEVQSSPGKVHRYLLCDGIEVGEHRALQARLVADYGSDQNAADVARVLRLPGFYHRKGVPHMVRLLRAEPCLPYSRAAILAALPPVTAGAAKPKAATTSAATLTVDPKTITELRSALAALRSDDRATWIAVGQNLKSLGEVGRGLWIEWAQQSDQWKPSDARTWDNLAGDRSDYRAVFTKAQAPGVGWVNPMSNAAHVGVAANDGTPVDRPRLLRLVRADHIQLTPIDWTFRDYMVADSLVGLVGASGSGKSFIAVGMACCGATGTPWHGRDVRHGAVFYLAGEGQRGLKKRIAAWELHNGVSTAGAPLYISAGLPFLCDAEMAEASADEIAEEAEKIAEESGLQPVLIVIDTVARAMGGANENSSEDMGAFVRSMDVLRQRWQCTVLSVHHTGHSSEAQGRARGSSAYRAALDSEFLVTANGDAVTLSGTKEKDWPKPSPISFQKVAVPIMVPGNDGGMVEESGLAFHDMAGAMIEANKRERALELHRAGQTLRAISVQLGVSKSTIGNWLKAA